MSKEWFGNRYEQARSYEKQSQIRLRGQFWFQGLVFVGYCALGIMMALLVGDRKSVV